MADVEERVKQIIVEQLGVDEAEVTSTASFVDDLGADSLDTVELVASKAGLIGLTKAVAQEVASRTVTTNAVAPGFIATPMTDSLGEDAREKLQARIPLRRIGSDRDVAVAVRFLASEAAGYITGQVLHVNGGLYMA